MTRPTVTGASNTLHVVPSHVAAYVTLPAVTPVDIAHNWYFNKCMLIFHF